MRWGPTGLLVGSVVVALGCVGSEYGPADNPTEVRAVTGVPFGWSCDSSGCQITLAAGTPAPDPCTSPGDQPGYGTFWGRFFSVCSVCVTSRSDGSTYWST